VFLLLLPGAYGVFGQSAAPTPQWQKIGRVAPDTRVQVTVAATPGGVQKIHGRLVAHDNDSITILLKDRTSRVVSRSDVREVRAASRNRRLLAPLIGAGVGAVAIGVPIGPALDLEARPRLAFAALGAGLGYLIGNAVRYRVVYSV
jgi:hypothetical protein